jgi:DNA polymerase-3 subunit beta
LVVAAKAADVGTSRIEMPISYLGDEVKITMDYRFVSDFFKALDLEKPFSIDVRSNAEPALFSTEDGYTYVVMPMARQ